MAEDSTPPSDLDLAEPEVRAPAQELQALLRTGEAEPVLDFALGLHPAELSDALERLDDEDRSALFAALPNQVLGDALHYAEPHFRGQLVRGLPTDQLSELLDGLADDVATDFVQEMEPATAETVLAALDASRRRAIERLLTHPEDTAGGRMTGQVVTVRPDFTVRRTLESLREVRPDANQPFYLYVTDQRRRLLGVLNLRGLITADADTPVIDVMTTDLITVTADADQEEAARLLRQYRLLAVPVLDTRGVLLGTVTSDDLIDVLEEEATEDMFRIVGVNEDEDLRNVSRSVRYRWPWLSVNLITALAAGFVVSLFGGTLERVVVLAAFVPVIAGHGGNAGIQTLTVVVRSMALGRVSGADLRPLIARELLTGLVLGASSGLMVAVVALLWQGNPWLGFVVGIALTANVIFGVFFGTLIPMGLNRLGQDPALSGGIWLTTTTDVLGLLVYLGLASLLVAQLE